ncbi:unnamed protein product [Caenorhabditis auriculariae]|uniref:Uncharacterized protein n=1 Tax=Caenorhabditis auriculariae TaxID=2777116 RepID=A0A8S1HLB7_9PELO|nr:unnamed protein product [Caenorhabditis auriculariae]
MKALFFYEEEVDNTSNLKKKMKPAILHTSLDSGFCRSVLLISSFFYIHPSQLEFCLQKVSPRLKTEKAKKSPIRHNFGVEFSLEKPDVRKIVLITDGYPRVYTASVPDLRRSRTCETEGSTCGRTRRRTTGYGRRDPEGGGKPGRVPVAQSECVSMPINDHERLRRFTQRIMEKMATT